MSITEFFTACYDAMKNRECKILSSVDEIQYRHKQQHVDRIKCIADVLEWFAVITLSATIQPDGNQCQKGKSLLAQLKFHAKELNRIHQTTQQFHIQPVQRN